jgi:hypothetical protein
LEPHAPSAIVARESARAATNLRAPALFLSSGEVMPPILLGGS